nr:endo alpha-1,4 polygalactosaminidase [FCB group bacterium]
MPIIKYTVLLIIFSLSCVTGNDEGNPAIDYREKMREFVQNISSWTKSTSSGFLIIPQNGQELFTENGEFSGLIAVEYIAAIDATGREDLFFGYNNDDELTPEIETEWMIGFLALGLTYGKEAFVTDYCRTEWKVDSSYAWNDDAGFISFAADHRELDNIPVYPAEPWNVNQDDVTSLEDVKNFLYLIDPEQYSSKNDYLDALGNTDYDLLIIDLYWNEEQLSLADVEGLRNKASGGCRLVIAYMSIGEAEDYRYYWQSDWNENPPFWLCSENPEWPGNYIVKYWESQWQNIIF